MTYVNDLDLNALTTKIDQLLADEKSVHIDSHEAYLISLNRRMELIDLQQKLTTNVQMCINRISRLARLADEENVRWASAVLMMNPVFLVLDTTGLSNDSDIIRVFIRDENGVLFDTIVKPLRQTNGCNTRFTGITQTNLEEAPTLSGIWEKLRCILRGRYVLSYNLEFVKGRLDENAKHYGLPALSMIAKCLQRTTAAYFNSYGSIKLGSACGNIGYPLPTYPTAPERALGQVQLLLAMTQGITTAPQPIPSSEPIESDTIEPDTSLELDDHPF